MSASTSGDRFEDLFAHEEWVRRLAVRLCAGGGEDVAQETWLETLRARGDARSARAWLGGVVRHLARRARRDARARAEREERAAATDASVPTPESLLARAELQQRVLAAVAALDEPYRVVVLMRYYESLRTDDIAERLGVPASTVRNRLARAHAQLRARLDREYGGEHAAWSALFAPTLAAMSPHKIAAGVGIAMKLCLIGFAAAVVLGVLILWHPTHETPRTARANAVATPVSAITRAGADAPTVSDRAETTGARAPIAAAPVDHVLVWGTIRCEGDAQLTAPALAVLKADGTDAPVSLDAQLASAELTLASEDGTSRRLTLGRNATYSAFGLTPGRCTLRVWGHGLVPLDEELVLPPDQEKVRHDITVRRALTLPVKFVTKSTGATFVIPSLKECRPSVVATLDHPARIVNVLGRNLLSNAVGCYREREQFMHDESIPSGCIGVLDVYATLPVIANCVLHDTVLSSRVVRGNEAELVFELDPDEVLSKLGALRFRCVDAKSGAPVEDARVSVNFQDTGGGGERIGAGGIVDIDKFAPGMRRVEIAAPSFAVSEHWVRIPPGGKLDMGTIELRPAVRLRGSVVDVDGRAVHAQIAASPVRALASPRAARPQMTNTSATSGSFVLDAIESGPVRLVATHDDFALAVIDVDATSGPIAEIEIRMEKGTPVTFRLPHASIDRVDLVIADASGRVLTSISAYAMSAPRLRLKPGTYELRYVVDDEIARTESLEVGDDPIVHEVRAP